MLKIAETLSERGTCQKLKVGCVLVDEHYRIVGSGYNGVGRGLKHCTVDPCPGANAPKGSDLCEAIHAESNALLACTVSNRIEKCYVTHAPCLRCTKTLLNTPCKEILFSNDTDLEQPAKDLWLRAKRKWTHVGLLESELKRLIP
jgi:dCMP deaminase